MSDLPGYIWVVVLVMIVVTVAAIGVALHKGAVVAGLGRRRAARIAGAAVAIWLCWVAASAALAAAGAYRQDPEVPRPWFGLAFLGSFAAALAATRIPAVSRALADPGALARLALPHAARLGGLVFLVVMALGQLPAVFAVPAGLGDAAIGLAAPFVAHRLARGEGRTGAVWFNVLGIVDLVVAVTLGTLASASPIRLLHVEPSTEALGLLPLALIVTTGVPLVLALHVISLRRLATRPAAAAKVPARILG